MRIKDFGTVEAYFEVNNPSAGTKIEMTWLTYTTVMPGSDEFSLTDSSYLYIELRTVMEFTSLHCVCINDKDTTLQCA